MRAIGRFILRFFTVIGIFTSTVVLGVGAWLVVAADRPEPLPERILLRVDIKGGIADRHRVATIFRGASKRSTLREYVEGLQVAAADDRVQGIALYMNNARIGIAGTQELRQAIAEFRSKAKFAHIFSEDMGGMGSGTGQYYLASAFDEIWLQPSGGVGLIGMSIEIPFAKGVLEKLEVEQRFEKRHEFKAGAEQFMRDKLSKPARRNLQALLDSLFAQVATGIAQGRGMTEADVRELVDSGPYLAGEARDAGLVNRLGYLDEFIADALERAGEGAKEVSFGRYLAAIERPNAAGPQVALIYGNGAITGGGGEDAGPFEDPGFRAHRVAKAIADAVKDEAIKAILFRVNSPGGSYLASDLVWREMARAREAGKPVIVSMGRVAASGGYFVALPANRIVAEPGTVTGSIGVYGGKIVTKKFWEGLGVTWDQLSVGKRATMWSMVTDFPPGSQQRFSAMLDFVYEDFTAKTMAARELSAEQIDAVARGRVWSGRDALENGLIDALGGYRVAVDEVKSALELGSEDTIHLVRRPKDDSIERLLKLLGGGGPLVDTAVLFGLGGGGDLARLARQFEPLAGDISLLFPPAGVLQMPPIRIDY